MPTLVTLCGWWIPMAAGSTEREIRQCCFLIQFSSVAQSCPTLCDPMNHSTPGILSITNSQSLLKLMSIESVMPSNHLILCCLFLLWPSIFPSIMVFSNKQALSSSGQSIGASASVLLMNIQGWFPLGLSGLISLQSKGFSRAFSSTTVWKHSTFSLHYTTREGCSIIFKAHIIKLLSRKILVTHMSARST